MTFLLQRLPTASQLFAKLCDHIHTSAGSLSQGFPQEAIWTIKSGSPAGLGLVLPQICSIISTACKAGGPEEVIQSWLSCAESVMGSCMELMRSCPAYARANVFTSGESQPEMRKREIAQKTEHNRQKFACFDQPVIACLKT